MQKLLTAFIAAGLFAAVLTSCNDEENTHPQVIVEFAEEESSVSENAGEKIIELHFDKSSLENGEVEITVSPEQAKYFTTNPATVNGRLLLEVHKSQASVTFSLAPVNDMNLNQDRLIEFTLSKSQGNFIIGDQNKFSLTIEDDELSSTHSYANFIPANASISETYAQGYPLQVHLSESATCSGSVV